MGVQLVGKFSNGVIDDEARHVVQQGDTLLGQLSLALCNFVQNYTRNEKAVLVPFLLPPPPRSELVRRRGEDGRNSTNHEARNRCFQVQGWFHVGHSNSIVLYTGRVANYHTTCGSAWRT